MKRFKEWIFPILILAICFFLAYKNYTPGTFLIGWDSLHPEFNFSEAFKRVVSGVWREEQGLGVIAAHSHMADWSRIVFLFLESYILPASFLRYSYIFLCLLSGPLGVYFFLSYVLSREKEGIEVYLASFLGALYYLFNLGALQHFFVPFEMFTAQFAFLPWLFLFALKYLREKRRKNLVIFAILTVVAGPQAYAATLFYAYLGALVVFVFSYRRKKGLILILLTLFLNAYWLLPNLYSVIYQSQTVINSNINRLFTPEAILRSFNYENLADILIHKNFLFGWRAFDFGAGGFVDLMGAWNIHLSSPNILSVLYLTAVWSLLGVVASLFKKDRVGYSLFFIAVYAFLFLAGGNFLKPGVLQEALRMPFTKFSIIFLFSSSFFFGYFFFRFLGITANKYLKKMLLLTIALVVSSGLIFSVLPMFQGQLISSVVRTKLPSEYLKLFGWFNDKKGRVAVLPLNTLWGWDYHSWKYEGSGFLGFGLANPLLVRDYDRWSPYNETFFSEAARALYASDNQAFDNALRKYQVKYLLLDESILNAGGDEKLLFVPEIKEIFSDLNYQPVFKDGFLTVYETPYETNKFVSTPETYTAVNADLTYSSSDPIYTKYGDYIQSGDGARPDSIGVSFPFVNFDSRGLVTIKISNDKLQISNEKQNAKVILPVKDKITETFGPDRGFKEAYNCDLKKTGKVYKSHLVGGIVYKAEDGGVACDYFNYPDLKSEQAYVLRVKGENKQGRSLKIYLQNWETNRMDLEELLPEGKFDSYFVVFGGPHTLNLETRSFGRIASENVIESIEIYPFDINFLINLTGNSEKPVTKTNNLQILSVNKIGTTFYQVKTEGEGLLELGQGYESGWLALQITNSKFQIPNLLEHTKINSWANGWIILVPSASVFIVFWPQLLEWAGMILGFAVLIYLLVDKQRR